MYRMTFMNRVNAANSFVVDVQSVEKVQSYLKMMAKEYHISTRKNGKVLKSYSR